MNDIIELPKEQKPILKFYRFTIMETGLYVEFLIDRETFVDRTSYEKLADGLKGLFGNQVFLHDDKYALTRAANIDSFIFTLKVKIHDI